MNQPIIKIESLSKVFKGKKFQRVEALKELDLEVFPGEIFGFLGPNGAGKSTTIKLLTGQIRPNRGTCRIFGLPNTSLDARKKIGYLPENPAFYDFLTADEYLILVGRIFKLSPKTLEKETARLLERLDLAHAAKRPIRSYSKGMVQRLGLAQTLLHDPDLYILDEPMSGLDPVGRALVKEILLEMKQAGKTIFFSTHITNDVEMICDRFGILAKGELRAVDSIKNVFSDNCSGFTVEVVAPDGTPVIEHCTSDSLPQFLQTLQAQKYHLQNVRPRRRSLEEYFLDVINAPSRHVS